MAKWWTFIETHRGAVCERSWSSWSPKTVLQTVLPRDLFCQNPGRQKQRNCSRNYREDEGVSHRQPPYFNNKPTEFNTETDEVHRLPLANKQKQIEKTSSTPNIMCKFKTHSYREKLLSKKNELYPSRHRT